MDTVAQFLTMIRNAGTARHEKVDVPCSNVRLGIAKILQETDFIRSYKVAKDSKQGVMRVYLKYDSEGNHAITKLDKVSTPGRRVYVKSDSIPEVRSGLGTSIISTSQGIISGAKAKEKNLGGELLCVLW